MDWRHRPLALWIWAAAALLCASLALAAEPKVELKRFHNLPARLFFFDDSTTVIYHDSNEGNIYVSQDEGNKWDKAAGIPDGDAMMFVEHPFNNRYAFVLTKHKKHYRTDDRGKTWRTFETPTEPAWVSTPLAFHSDPDKYRYILYQGTKCERSGWRQACHDETYYTKEAFEDTPKLLLSETSRCQFAHSRKDFKHDAHPDLIYCVAFDTETQDGSHSIKSSRLYSSTDYFDKENKLEDLGIGKDARGVIALAIVSKFAVVALKDFTPGNNGEMLLYVTVDAKTWAKAQFPHASSARLRENAYTIVESTTHSLGVDVVLEDHRSVGTLFVSNSNGTYFVESLKDTNRNEAGYVDFENLYGVDGVGIANIVRNAQEVESRNTPKQLSSRITFDDGRTWQPIRAPATDVEGKSFGCSPTDIDDCSIHLYSVTQMHNFGRVFSSPAPGFVMGVGSVGPHLKTYTDSDTFLSTDAGISWKMVHKDAHIYEFGDSGSVIVMVNDEEATNVVRYSTDLGKTWRSLELKVSVKARALTTVPDSTSQKFILIGQLSRRDKTAEGGYVAIFLDFAPTRSKQCGEGDLEKWYARNAKGKECLMGHKQWYTRKKVDADCYVGHKFEDPKEHEEKCACEDSDYECDFNYVRNGDKCEPLGPEPIPANVCITGSPDETYEGSSGYRLIPGNTCDRGSGVSKDKPVIKKCSQAAPPEGEVTHQIFKFQSQIIQQQYFKDSTTILVLLSDGTAWQSSNEGYTWQHLAHDEKVVAFYMHRFSPDRAYLITDKKKFYFTTDTGKSWYHLETPVVPNIFGVPVLSFNPKDSDTLIYTGSEGCENGFSGNCHAVAYYTRKNGRDWKQVEKYVRNCQWARDHDLKVDPTEIVCESYKTKKGVQPRAPNALNAPELITGMNYYSKKKKVFDSVIGYAKFSEYLVVAEVQQSTRSLDLQVSLDGRNFATGMFPPSMKPDQHAYTILESSTNSLFLHVTMNEIPHLYWGNILKSNSNGTYFGMSAENVNRDDRGYVDFEKMIGLDGIALINVVENPSEATVSGRKKLQSRITHNDGGTWKPITPPAADSTGRSYDCKSVKCALQVHGYTERFDPRATYSTPSVPGLLMAVGNVGETLAPYTDSDTFLSRDAGFTWEEVHKDAHLWEFGDSGSILVMANDEEPTDHVLFTTDEGKTWREYKFTLEEKIRVRSIFTVPSDTSRRFILFGEIQRGSMSVAVHLDFSSLTRQQCVFSAAEPNQDDFELWSPSEERQEQCLFGRQTLYQRRKRDRNCVVGDLANKAGSVKSNCACKESDFECEYNYIRQDGKCILLEKHEPLADDPDEQCRDNAEFWYERTAYRKIGHSSCEEGIRPDRGTKHACPGFSSHSSGFWWSMVLVPFGVAGLAGWWYQKRRAAGPIRLPGGGEAAYRGNMGGSGVVETLASVPWFLLGLASIAWERVSGSMSGAGRGWRSQRGYRNVPVDEDARILTFRDED